MSNFTTLVNDFILATTEQQLMILNNITDDELMSLHQATGMDFICGDGGVVDINYEDYDLDDAECMYDAV